jgi:hypothetical protein
VAELIKPARASQSHSRDFRTPGVGGAIFGGINRPDVLGFSPGSVSILPVQLTIMRNRAVPMGLRDSWIQLPRIHVRCGGLHPGLFSHSPCREKVAVARCPNRGNEHIRMWRPFSRSIESGLHRVVLSHAVDSKKPTGWSTVQQRLKPDYLEAGYVCAEDRTHQA